jgi:alpha-tubulin suppressor-like RCC1 family protein
MYVVEEREVIFNDVISIQSKTNFKRREWEEAVLSSIPKNEIKENSKESIDENPELLKTVSDNSFNKELEANKHSILESNRKSILMEKKEENLDDKIDSKTVSMENTNYNKTGQGFLDKSHQIVQIVKGKHHLIKLTLDGKTYSSGTSYYGVVGLGGNNSVEKSIQMPNLASMKIVQISCGMYHSLALNDNGDLYAWGMGYEGQLGLSYGNKVVSSPRYVSFFYRRPVKFISCGHNFSICITNDNNLWGWGENKLGQLGLGKVQLVETPTCINIYDRHTKQESISNDSYRRYSGLPLVPCYVDCGYAHSAVVTEEGHLITFGLNINGQLGIGNTTTCFEPQLIERDNHGNLLNKVVKVCCNTSGTFIITQEGKLYSCGSGDIGHGALTDPIKLPKLISDGRVYHSIYCNDNSIVAFCKLRIISISPNSGPATGNTIIAITPSAFKEFPKLLVRFSINGVNKVNNINIGCKSILRQIN